MKKFLTNLLAVLMLVVVGFGFVGCDEETPETPETPPAEAPAETPGETQLVNVETDKTYKFSVEGDEMMLKLTSGGGVYLVFCDLESATIPVMTGTYMDDNGIYYVSLKSSDEVIYSDFEDYWQSGFNNHDLPLGMRQKRIVDEYIFLKLLPSETGVVVDFLGDDAELQCSTIVEEDAIIEDGSWDAFLQQEGNEYYPVDGEVALYVKEDKASLIQSGYGSYSVSQISDFVILGDKCIFDYYNGEELLVFESDDFNGEQILCCNGAFLKRNNESDYKINITETLEFTADSFYLDEAEVVKSTKVLDMSLTLNVDKTVEFVGPDGNTRTGTWDRSLNYIILSFNLVEPPSGAMVGAGAILTTPEMAVLGVCGGGTVNQENFEAKLEAVFTYKDEVIVVPFTTEAVNHWESKLS